jgi:hypothetical protein
MAIILKCLLHHFPVLELILQHLEEDGELGVVKFRDFRVRPVLEPAILHLPDHRFKNRLAFNDLFKKGHGLKG